MDRSQLARTTTDAYRAAEHLLWSADQLREQEGKEPAVDEVCRAACALAGQLEYLDHYWREEVAAHDRTDDLVNVLFGLLRRAVRGERLTSALVTRTLVEAGHYVNVFEERSTTDGLRDSACGAASGPPTS
jgi:hypothetical protein